MIELAKNDILFAHMALGLAPGLSSAAKRVGAALLEHFNRKTGRCDPSVERLARLLGVDEKTIRRATKDLVAKGMFKKSSHGGRHNTAAYSPNWPCFRLIIADWNALMKSGKGVGKASINRTEMSGDIGQKCPLDADKNALQTDRTNRKKEPGAVSLSTDGAVAGGKGLGKEGAKQPQRNTVHGFSGGKSVSRSDAAEAAEARKQSQSIQSLPSVEEREAAWMQAMSGDTA
ncbi:helix-turn-helix domain-containing protein [Mesorhizobium sp. 10J20-29]